VSGTEQTFQLDTESTYEADQVLQIMSHLEAGDPDTLDQFNKMLAAETGGDIEGATIVGATVSAFVHAAHLATGLIRSILRSIRLALFSHRMSAS
jgi:hypothetical protein